mgnify:CR=1 FL=1
MDVRTDHQIVAFGTERMMLFDSEAGTVIVDANRSQGIWTIEAQGIPNITASNRPDAIQAMVDQALAALPGTGYSCTVPHGLTDLP